ncbi:acetylornithine transaminase [Verrucomicrobiales bacterium]|nr:acetylornithine transaminase [Verrucomicrobiales bacterium]
MSDAKTTTELTDEFLLGNYGRFPVAFSRGQGGYIFDEEGNKFLDFATGIAVCALGHCPPVMQKALTEQGGKLIHCSNLYQIREQAELGRFVVERMMERPGKVFFCNSGAEANDGLIKLARKRAYDKFGAETTKRDIVTCRQSFHGRTLGGIAATGQEKVKVGFDPLLPGFLHVPFNDPAALREAVSENTAAILFEPIQGEGGINTATVEFMAMADRLREQFDLLLMFDEVQCGSGRTGDWCGWRTLFEHTDIMVEPDAVSWAKGFGGGFPIGSFWASDDCAGSLGPGTHGSTFGGTPLGSAVSLAVLEEIERCGALENVKRQEARIREAVSSWNCPLVESLRGVGLLLGFVLNTDEMANVPGFSDSGQTPALFVVNEVMKQHMLTVPAGADVVRWLPRLDVPDAEIDEALTIFREVLEGLVSR